MGVVNVAVAGASGRMGRALVEALSAAPGARLAAAFDMAGSPALGQDAGAALGLSTGVAVGEISPAALDGVQVLIDFTRPQGTLAHLALCRAARVAMVIGTTGFSAEEKGRIAAAAGDIGIVMAPNMSVGVNVLLALVEQAARVLGESYDVEIVEAHHKHKVDAPSGTALGLGEAAARGLGRDLAGCAVYAREGVTGERPAGAIGFATVRAGDIVGEHTVLFAGTGERVELSHKATSRGTFAGGAVRAAVFLSGRGAGLFNMRDVLGLG